MANPSISLIEGEIKLSFIFIVFSKQFWDEKTKTVYNFVHFHVYVSRWKIYGLARFDFE